MKTLTDTQAVAGVEKDDLTSIGFPGLGIFSQKFEYFVQGQVEPWENVKAEVAKLVCHRLSIVDDIFQHTHILIFRVANNYG